MKGGRIILIPFRRDMQTWKFASIFLVLMTSQTNQYKIFIKFIFSANPVQRCQYMCPFKRYEFNMLCEDRFYIIRYTLLYKFQITLFLCQFHLLSLMMRSFPRELKITGLGFWKHWWFSSSTIILMSISILSDNFHLLPVIFTPCNTH